MILLLTVSCADVIKPYIAEWVYLCPAVLHWCHSRASRLYQDVLGNTAEATVVSSIVTDQRQPKELSKSAEDSLLMPA